MTPTCRGMPVRRERGREPALVEPVERVGQAHARSSSDVGTRSPYSPAAPRTGHARDRARPHVARDRRRVRGRVRWHDRRSVDITTYGAVTYGVVGYRLDETRPLHEHLPRARPGTPCGRARGPSATAGQRDGRSTEVAEAVKPHLRGWIHARRHARSCSSRRSCSSCSPRRPPPSGPPPSSGSRRHAVRHQRGLPPRATGPRDVAGVLRRLDHTNIFLIIAGTYTPLAVLLLPADTARVLLIVVWAGALVGLLARVFWLGAPALGLRAGLRRARLGRRLVPPAVLPRRAARRSCARRRRRARVHARRGRLRHQAPQPEPALVRVPRGLPRADGRRATAATTSRCRCASLRRRA